MYRYTRYQTVLSTWWKGTVAEHACKSSYFEISQLVNSTSIIQFYAVREHTFSFSFELSSFGLNFGLRMQQWSLSHYSRIPSLASCFSTDSNVPKLTAEPLFPAATSSITISKVVNAFTTASVSLVNSVFLQLLQLNPVCSYLLFILLLYLCALQGKVICLGTVNLLPPIS